jgi:hypothetical protein
MRGITAVALTMLCACSFHSGALVDGGGGGGGDDDGSSQHPEAGPIVVDGAPDGGLDAPPDTTIQETPPCYGNSWWRVCLASTPTNLVAGTLSGIIDTGTAACVASTGANSDACVLVYTSISASGTVTVSGTRPLVLVATSGDIEISGELDAGSHSDAAACAAQLPAPTPATGNGGGGYGGSFVGHGGDGASRDGVSAGNAGAAIATTIGALRGGCPGGSGAGSAPNGGHGGGAIVMIANGTITVQGSLRAVGGGGGGGAVGSTVGNGSGGDATKVTPVMPTVGDGGGGGGAGAIVTHGTMSSSGTTNPAPIVQ